jgi:transcriptional regulator with XRE-family HTH domain
MPERYYSPDVGKLESLLIQKGWPTTEIAARGPFSQRTVDKIMQGHRVFRRTLKRLADVFSVKPEEIIRPGSPPVADDGTAKAEFTLKLSMPYEELDETSDLLKEFVAMMEKHVLHEQSAVELKCVQKGRVSITFEVDESSLKVLYYHLVSGYIQQFRPTGKPGDIQTGAGVPLAYLLWWVDEIDLPDDCPFEPLRGKVVTADDGFKLLDAAS